MRAIKAIKALRAKKPKKAEAPKPINCWEFKECGREPNGFRVSELGVCPAVTDENANGINRGKNGGRCCWVVSGSLCGGEVQGSYESKIGLCMDCYFYKRVYKEEVRNGSWTSTVHALRSILNKVM